MSSQARLLMHTFAAWCGVRGRQPAVRGARRGGMFNNELSISCAITNTRARAEPPAFIEQALSA